MAVLEARAERMEALLARSGIEPRRIATDGRGLSQPVASNATLEGRMKNRRIELIVTAK